MRDIVSPLAGFSSPFGRGADPYAILGYKPPLVLDYENSKFRVSGSTSTAPSVVTATRTGLATQLNSAGNLVWNAHNLMTYSEDFSNAAWAKVNAGVGVVPVVTANVGIAPDGTETADRVQFDLNGGTTSGDTSRLRGAFTNPSIATGRFWVKSNDGNTYTIGFNLGNSLDHVSVGQEWTLVDQNTSTAAGANAFDIQLRGAQTPTNSDTADLLIWGAHAYRSDLGGMAPVPLTRRVAGSTTYVPTTSAAVYLPREEAYTYVSGSLVGPYYQKESDARTNMVTYSEDFTDAVWTKSSSTATANATTAPDGTTTADKLSITAENGALYQLTTVTSGATAAASAYLKFDDCDWIVLRLIDEGTPTSQVRVWLNLSTGAIGTSSATGAGATLLSASVEDVGGGWYRLAVVGSHAGVSTYRFQITTADGDASDTRAVIGASYFIWGAQLEEGSTLTSYIPTAGSTVTRSADSTTISAGNMPYPTPQVIGPELVTNGTFQGDTIGATPATWVTNNANASLIKQDDGTALFTSTSFAYARIEDASRPVLPAGVYQVSFEISEWVAGLSLVHVGLSTGGNTIAGNGSYSYLFTSTVEQAYEFQIRPNGGGTGSFKIDNISVREINPLALSFQMEGLMTYADTGVAVTAALGSGAVSFVYHAVNDSNGLDIAMDTQSGETGEINFRQRASGVTDVIRSSTTTYSPGINVPFNIASRHGSTFINGAVDGSALIADTTPTALPDLSAATFDLAPTFNGFIKEFRVWADDIGDSGIAEAST